MDLDIANDAVAFNGRFGGVATDIYVPVNAVIGIYARENGQGMEKTLDALTIQLDTIDIAVSEMSENILQ